MTLTAAAARAQEPVTITVQGQGRPEGELLAEPFAASSRVRAERLAAPALRAPDVLRSEAGVQIAEAGGLGAPATASIRGATSAQTPIYLGGVRLNDNVGGVSDLSAIPLWLVDHVDVYRGNAPFGADEPGIGGALYFEPRRPRGHEASVVVTAGSFGTRSGAGYVALGDQRASVLVGASAERADNDYPFTDNRGTLFQAGDDAESTRRNSDSRLRDAWLVARSRPDSRSRLELLANLVTREQGAPTLALVPSRRARAELQRGLAALTARLGLDDAGRHTLTLRSTLLEAASQLHDPARELGALSEETEVRGRRLEQQAILDFALTSRVAAGLALLGGAERLVRSDAGHESSASAGTLRATGHVVWRALPALSLRTLLALQCRTAQPGADGCRDFEPTGRVGAGWQTPGATLFVNLSRYQREPALGELYGAGVLVRGNSQLRPELGLSADFGARAEHRFERLRLWGSAGAFLRSAEQLVTYVRTAQGYVVPLNVAGARVAGLELSLGGEAFGHLRLEGAATLLEPRDTTAGRRLSNDILPFVSRLVLAPRAELTTGELAGKLLSRADLSVELTYLSNRFADAAGLIVIPEQATLGVGARASWFGGVFSTRARVANALGSERFDIVGYPLPGRSLYVSAEVHIE
ncbi:MAG TPA: TonB-dependent receptor [Polyangiaceae bacterium]|nr:TonB-dependent receptor [Polyangiaceae bacterium]